MIFVLRFLNIAITRPYLRLLLKPGRNFRSGYFTRFENTKGIAIGENFFCGPLCQISASPKGSVKIGNDVMFGPNVMVLGGNHELNSIQCHIRFSGHAQDDKGIVIEDGVWIGANAVIVDGAYISEGAVIGAGSLVSKTIPPYCIAAGSPAKVVRRRMGDRELEILLKNVNSKYSISTVAKAETLNRDQK